jgi:hypothetical protein
MKNNRRTFLKGAMSFITARGLLSLASVSALLAPRLTSAQYVQAAVTIISTLNSLSSARNANGMAMRLAAIDLKLDQVLQNQILLAQAVEQVQKSITELQSQVPGFITAESYRLLWEEAYGIFEQLKKLNQRPVPVSGKIADFQRLFAKLYDSVTVVRSRIATTHTGAQGVASMLSASQALILYVDCMTAMAAFERALPNSKKWEDDRAQKLKEMSETLIASLEELQQKRIPEAIADQTEIAAEQLRKMSPLWKGLWDQLMEAAAKAPQLDSHSVDQCFRSDYYKVKVFKDTMHNIAHLDFTLTFASHIYANKVAAVSGVRLTEKPKLASMGLKRHWVEGKGKWQGIRDRAAYEEFAKHWPKDRGPALAIWYAFQNPNTDPCALYPLPIPPYPGGDRFGISGWDTWGDTYFKGAFVDAAHFSSLCDTHAQAILYLEVLRKCQEIGKKLKQECLLFTKSVDNRYEEDTSLWNRILGLFE